jgi:hypothetical protein
MTDNSRRTCGATSGEGVAVSVKAHNYTIAGESPDGRTMRSNATTSAMMLFAALVHRPIVKALAWPIACWRGHQQYRELAAGLLHGARSRGPMHRQRNGRPRSDIPVPDDAMRIRHRCGQSFPALDPVQVRYPGMHISAVGAKWECGLRSRHPHSIIFNSDREVFANDLGIRYPHGIAH